MSRRTGGLRRKTRYKFKKEKRTKGKISLSKYFQTFDQGDKVYLSTEPAIQKGMYNPKFLGKVGLIQGKRGNCYKVNIKDFTKEKTLIVHPVHLIKIKEK